MDHITTRLWCLCEPLFKVSARKQLLTIETLEAYSNKFPYKIKDNEKNKQQKKNNKKRTTTTKNYLNKKMMMMMMMMIIKWSA